MRAAWLPLTLALLLAAGTARAADVPPPSRGFQLAIRSGAAVPFGSVSSTVSMSDALGVQVPFLVDAGWKPGKSFFIGAYGGLALGGAAGQVAATCDRLGVSCVGLGFRAGIMAQYHARPDELFNPWFGYGFGYEIGGSSGSNLSNSVSNSVRGFELAHLMGGLDWRLQDIFGAGPFLDLAIGRYDVAESRTNAGGRVSSLGGAIDQKAFHMWLVIGLRAVLYP